MKATVLFAFRVENDIFHFIIVVILTKGTHPKACAVSLWLKW